MVPKSDHLANPRFDEKPSAQVERVDAEVKERLAKGEIDE